MSGMKKCILVTGGGGFIGSHCILELLREDFDVVVVDNFDNCVKGPSSYPESLVRVQQLTGKELTFYEADLIDKESIRKVFAKHSIDCVIHFAALKCVWESCKIPLRYFGNNVAGSANLLEVMNEFDVKKIVFSSSCTVYGDPEYLPVDENHPTGKCTNPYGKSKYFMEEIISEQCKANSDWGAMLLRYFNPVGAHPSGEIGEDPLGIPNNLMPYIAQVAVGRREKLQIFGGDYETADGTGIRDYIHVMDLAVGHVAALKKLFKDDMKGVKAYNLGTGTGYSVLEVVEAFEGACGRSIPYEIVDRRAGDVAMTYAACSLAEKELDWKAVYTLYDMCRDMWKWQSKNPAGYCPQ